MIVMLPNDTNSSPSPASMLPNDTDPKVARMQIELIRQMSPARRLQIAASMSAMVVGLSRQTLEQKLGNSEAAKIEWVRLNYGLHLAEQLQASLENSV